MVTAEKKFIAKGFCYKKKSFSSVCGFQIVPIATLENNCVSRNLVFTNYSVMICIVTKLPSMFFEIASLMINLILPFLFDLFCRIKPCYSCTCVNVPPMRDTTSATQTATIPNTMTNI